ncbi:MAG: hypothetical protein ACSHWZ_14570, partial [Sulfitobacter sp.]
GSGGTKGSGSGGTKGSGSGGTKGSGSGGTKGSGSGGTKGSGSGGTNGGGTNGGGDTGGGTTGGGTTGGGDTGGGDTGGDEKTTYTYQMGNPSEVEIDVTLSPEGSLFFVVKQANYDGNDADIDGVMFNVAEDSTVDELAVYPDENNTDQGDLTGLQLNANGVTELSNGAGDGNAYDIGLQFGEVTSSVEGNITQTNFTLRSEDGSPLSFDDIDLNSMKVIVNSEGGNGEVLGVTGSDNPSWTSSEPNLNDIMGLMNQEVEDEDEPLAEDQMDDEDDIAFI